MNILTDKPPESVTIDHTEYPLETDFRNALRIIMAFEDNELTAQEKQIVLLQGLYDVHVPNDLRAGTQYALWFLNGGEENEDDTNGLRLYSFSKDQKFIYAAFRQTHGIDLQTAHLHWWTFLALFMDLGQDTTFCQLTALRKRIATGKATKEERAAAREMPDLINVPALDTRTLEEKDLEAEFLRKVHEAKQKRQANDQG